MSGPHFGIKGKRLASRQIIRSQIPILPKKQSPAVKYIKIFDLKNFLLTPQNQKEIIISYLLFLSVQNSKCVIVEHLLGKKFITCLVFTLTIALLSGCFPDLQNLNFVLHQQHEIQNIKNTDSQDHNSKPNGHEHHSEVCTDNCIENSKNFSLTIHIFEEKFVSRFSIYLDFLKIPPVPPPKINLS